ALQFAIEHREKLAVGLFVEFGGGGRGQQFVELFAQAAGACVIGELVGGAEEDADAAVGEARDLWFAGLAAERCGDTHADMASIWASRRWRLAWAVRASCRSLTMSPVVSGNGAP